MTTPPIVASISPRGAFMILFPFVGASPQTIARGELVKVIRLTTRVRRPLRREFAPLRAALFEGTPMATGSEAIRLPQLPKYSGLETIVVGPGKLVIQPLFCVRQH